MGKYVSEIFGYPPSNKTSNALSLRSSYKCPFHERVPASINGECDPVNKKSNLADSDGKLLLKHQTGACSVWYKHRGSEESTPNIICPYRFYEKNQSNQYIVFEYIKSRFFQDKPLYFIPEVGLGKYGRADGLLCNIYNGKIEDYAHIEFQADATTGTRSLVECVKDYFNGEDITNKDYNYGLNSKASIKGSSLQMIDKGFLFDSFGKKSIWIMHENLFNILLNIYNVQMTDVTNTEVEVNQNLIFIVVGLEFLSSLNTYKLKIKNCFSSSPADLQDAISNKEPLEESYILEKITSNVSEGNYEQI